MELNVVKRRGVRRLADGVVKPTKKLIFLSRFQQIKALSYFPEPQKNGLPPRRKT
jgi:hypothetical protein